MATLEAQLANSPTADRAQSTSQALTETPTDDLPYPDLTPPPIVSADLGSAIYRAVQQDSTPTEKAALATFLLEKVMGQRNLGYQAFDWRLGLPAMAKELTTHLVDSSLAACFARLPAFTTLIQRLGPYDLNSLENSPLQVTIAVLCALGARSSPHSALLGVPIPSNQAASAALLLTVGDRREKACRALAALAWDKTSHGQLQAFFDPGSALGAEVLNLQLVRTRLSEQVEDLLRRRITRLDIEEVLASAQAWTSSIQRQFALLATVRSPAFPPVPVSAVKTVWKAVDDVHFSVQRLQQILVNLNYMPDGMDTRHTSVDRHVLLAARLDTRLADVCNYLHIFLERKVQELPQVEGWRELLNESGLRVRKCIKLSAFYYQLFLSSADKHIVYSLTLQMDALPNWTQMACQRVGTLGGPPSSEFEVSEEELEWISKGLQIACFYTPRAAPRLQELEGGRRLIMAHREAGSPLPNSEFTPYATDPADLAADPTDPDPLQYDLYLPNDTSFDFSNLGQVQGTDSFIDHMRDWSPPVGYEALALRPDISHETFDNMALTNAWDGKDGMTAISEFEQPTSPVDTTSPEDLDSPAGTPASAGNWSRRSPSPHELSPEERRQPPLASNHFFALTQIATILATDGVAHQQLLPTRGGLPSHVKSLQVTLKLKSGEVLSGVGEGEDPATARAYASKIVLVELRQRGLVGGALESDELPIPFEGAHEGSDEACTIRQQSDVDSEGSWAEDDMGPPESKNENLPVSTIVADLGAVEESSTTGGPVEVQVEEHERSPNFATGGLIGANDSATVTQVPLPGDRFDSSAAFLSACRDGLLATLGATMRKFKVVALPDTNGDWVVDDEQSFWEHDHGEDIHEDRYPSVEDDSVGEGGVDLDDGDFIASPSSSSQGGSTAASTGGSHYNDAIPPPTPALDVLLSDAGRQAAYAEQRRIGNPLFQGASQAASAAYLAAIQTLSTKSSKQDRLSSFTKYCTKISVPIFPITPSIVCLWINDVNYEVNDRTIDLERFRLATADIWRDQPGFVEKKLGRYAALIELKQMRALQPNILSLPELSKLLTTLSPVLASTIVAETLHHHGLDSISRLTHLAYSSESIVTDIFEKLGARGGVTRLQCTKVDVLLCTGDFQAVRNRSDLETLDTPARYRVMGDIHNYYAGRKTAPIRQGIFLETFCDITFLTRSSGVFDPRDFMKGHYESVPFTGHMLSTSTHARQYEILRLWQLQQFGPRVNILMWHIEQHGDKAALLAKNPTFAPQIQRGIFGSPALRAVVGHIKPQNHLAGHHHARFSATHN
ncbi:hypothetical protein RQP46_009305 [Phenoliferia psychrophenolica]